MIGFIKKTLFLLLCCQTHVFAVSGQPYLEKFMTYLAWTKNLPTAEPSPDFLAFIENDGTLARRLREKWLYQLALRKDWVHYNQYYAYSTDRSLQCYELIARYNQGQAQAVLQSAKTLYLNGDEQPPACNQLFSNLFKSGQFNEQLLTQRIQHALEKRNTTLVSYLLKQYKQPKLLDIQTLAAIDKNPLHINHINSTPFEHDFYLYGLKRLVSRNMDKALSLWGRIKQTAFFDESRQQIFLAHVALYKAMRDEPDTAIWFAQIKPAYYTPPLLDWQRRYAIKHEQWAKLEALLEKASDNKTPCWQYWLARAAEEQGQYEKADAIYKVVANERNYYGFLASAHLKQPYQLHDESSPSGVASLYPYKPFTNQIKLLYHSNQSLQASRLLNDFVSELPLNEKSALLYWINNELNWTSKSLYLSSTDDMANQLTLRFPMAYDKIVSLFSNHYQIPKELIYAIIRQESAFRGDAISSAGAQGLMQLMPATARKLSARERIGYINQTLLFLPHLNIQLGAAYLKELATRFKRNPLFMIAAYNAGPTQVDYWIKNQHAKKMDVWVETLPWPETRNYIKNVIAFYVVYQYRLHKQPDLSIFFTKAP